MKSYLAILKTRFKTIFQYRAAAFAAICTQFFWGIVTMMIFRAFYSEATGPEPITLSQAITFLWLGQALLQMIPWSLDKEIEAQVKNGNVAYELLRPIHLYELWFVRSFAHRSIPTLMRCIPIFVFAGLFFGLTPPVSFQAGCAFSIAVFLGLLLSSSITTVVLISLFWTISGEGIQRLLPHLSLIFSGLVVPLPLFPSWMQPLLNLQPFRGILDIPCRLYTGVIPVDQALYYFVFQIIWIAILVLFGQWLLSKALKNFVVQGG